MNSNSLPSGCKIDYDRSCPCCCQPVDEATRETLYRGIAGVYVCSSCGAIFGRCSGDDSLKVVSSKWHTGPESAEDWKYFDLLIPLESGHGEARFHGWFHRETHDILQTG